MSESEMRGHIIRYLEMQARDIGRLIQKGINDSGEKHFGFCLILFSFNGPELTYLSNAERESMIKALEEFIQRQRSGEAPQTWEKRN